MDKKITIFTPTFNRAYLLGRLYESLKSQINNAFIWMVIDDGSTDGTDKIVSKWINDNVIKVEYYYKENGGMHTAYNLAYKLINTELNVAIDSDDKMPHDAVDKILKIWEEKKFDTCAGIIGLNADFEGNILGNKAPECLNISTTIDLKYKYKARGDKVLVYRTDIMKKMAPYPEYEGEKLVPFYNILLIDQKYKMIITNEILCHVEYQKDGSTNTVFKQYLESPRGFAEARKISMKYLPYLIDRLRNAIHYVSSSFILRNKNFMQESPRKMLTLFAMPFGILLYLYLKLKAR